jgi:hypothetical protein
MDDVRFRHGDTNYDAAAYALLGVTALVGSALVWALWQIGKHLWRWPRS